MFNRNDLIFPQQEIIVTRNTNRDSWVGQCEVFNRNPGECVGVLVRQLDRSYHYNYRLLEGSSFLLQASGSVNDFHSFKFMVVFNDDKGGPVGDTDKVMKGADREEIERMVEKGQSMLLEDLSIVYGNVLNSTDWKSRLEKFAPYRASIRVRIPSLPFCKRRTILIPEVGAQNHRVNESNDILQDTAVTHQEELDQGDQQIRKVLRIKKFTDFEIRAQKLFRNFSNPSEPYRAEHAEVFPNRYIQFKRETRIQLKKGKRSYNPWIGEVTIRNHAPSHYLIYKLRTTAPQHYVVMPTEGVLMPRFRRKMFSLKYQTSKFTDTLEHLNKTVGATTSSNNVINLQNTSAVFGDDAMSEAMETASAKAELVQADTMMDKKFFRNSVGRNAPQNKIRCENHRFADTQNFASLARDTLNEKEHEEQADSVSIRFLYSDVIAEGEALSSGDAGPSNKKQQQQQSQQPLTQQQQQLRDDRLLSLMQQKRAGNNRPQTGLNLLNRSSFANITGHRNDHNTSGNNVDGYQFRSSSTSDFAMGMKQSTMDVQGDRFMDANVYQGDTASMETSRSSTEITRLLAGGAKEDETSAMQAAAQPRIKTQKRKDQATWMKMASTERSAEVKDEKNHVQSHVFLLDVAFVDPYAVDERNYNIEELFRHTETLTGGYKMSRCFYPYFVPEDTISGPVIVYPKNDVIVDRGIGSPHVHWLTEIYLVNIHKCSLYFCIIPQEEDYGQLELGDEILVTPRSGHLLHYSEKRRFCGNFESNMSDSLCEQIQIYLRYTRTCFMEDGPIFKLHIFFFTESAAPEWLKNPTEAEKLDVSNPTYCNPLSRALDVVTVRIFLKDAEQQVATKNTLNYDDLDDTEDVFRTQKGENGQWSEAAKDSDIMTHTGNQRRPVAPRMSVLRTQPLRIQDTRLNKGFGELLHQTSHSAGSQHLTRNQHTNPVEYAYDCDLMSMTSYGYLVHLLTPPARIYIAGKEGEEKDQQKQEQKQEPRGSQDFGETESQSDQRGTFFVDGSPIEFGSQQDEPKSQ